MTSTFEKPSRRRTVLVTGAGSGLGRELCLHLAQNGFEIIVTDKDSDGADTTLSMLPKSQVGRAFELDVTREENITRALRQLENQNIDVLVNNAGLQHVAALESFPQQRWDTLVDVMLRGACLMTRSVLPSMRQRGYGRIVNIGSIHSLVASPYKSAYVAAKHGLLGFAKVMALETANTDITINTICPSYIRTPLVETQIADQAKAHGISTDEVIEQIMLDPMPKKAFITSEEVAATITFLCSQHARNITGQQIVMDGGWTIK